MSTKRLSDLTNAELSEVFAVEVLGWTHSVANAERGTRWWSDDKGNSVSPYSDPDSGFSFADSADAVLPYLQGMEGAQAHWFPMHGDWSVTCIAYRDASKTMHGRDKTFARAACIALITAKRAEKGEVK